MAADAKILRRFFSFGENLVSEMLAGAYLKAEGSEKTQASYLSTLCNNLATVSQNEDIAYVLSGDDFDFKDVYKRQVQRSPDIFRQIRQPEESVRLAAVQAKGENIRYVPAPSETVQLLSLIHI